MGTGPTAAAKDLRRLDLAAVARFPRREARSERPRRAPAAHLVLQVPRCVSKTRGALSRLS